MGMFGDSLGGIGAAVGGLLGGGGKVPTRNITKEGQKSMSSREDLAGRYFGSVDEYLPQQNQRLMDSTAQIYGDMSALQREQNPQLYGLLDTFAGQAADELAQGGYLGPDEVRQVQQDSRMGWNDRGMVRSEPSAFDEVLNLYGARRNRLATSRNFAGQVANMLSSDRDRLSSSALSAGGAGLSSLMQWFDPFNSYAAGVNDFNANANAASAMNKANLYGAIGGGVGSLFGGVLDMATAPAGGGGSSGGGGGGGSSSGGSGGGSGNYYSGVSWM